MADTVQFEGVGVRTWGTTKVRVFTGTALTEPSIFGGCAAPPAPAPEPWAPAPYYSLTPLRVGVAPEPDRPTFAPAVTVPGLTLSPVNMTLKEPTSADPETWEINQWRHFYDGETALLGTGEILDPLTLPPGGGLWIELDHLVPVTSGPPVNAALVGLVNPTLGAHVGLGLLGTAVTGSTAKIGLHVRLVDELLTQLPGEHLGGALNTSERRIVARISPANVGGVAKAQISLLSIGRTDPMVAAEIQELGTNSAFLWADMARFLAHFDTKPGLAIVGASMAPGVAPSASSVCRHLRIGI